MVFRCARVAAHTTFVKGSPLSAHIPRGYWNLTAVIFFSYLHQGILNVALPWALTDLSGTEFTAGVALALFGLASFLIRPAIGKQVDAKGSMRILLPGVAVLAVSGVGLVLPIVWVLVTANTIRGLGWAATNICGSVGVSDMAHVAERGRLSGIYSVFTSLATSFAPVLALPLLAAVGYVPVAFLAAVAAGLGALLSFRLTTWAPAASPNAAQQVKVSPSDAKTTMIEGAALLPAILLAGLMFSHPGLLSFIPLYGSEFALPLWSTTAYFVVYGITSVLARIFLASFSDKVGRLPAAGAALTASALSVSLLVMRPASWTLLFSALLFGLGQAFGIPALMAFVMDRVPNERMGAGMATYTAAFQLGSATGSLYLGWALSRFTYQQAYFGLLSGPLIGLVVCWMASVRQPVNQ